MSYGILNTHVTVHDVAEDTLDVATIERKGAFKGLKFVRVKLAVKDTPEVHLTADQARQIAAALTAAADEVTT